MYILKVTLCCIRLCCSTFLQLSFLLRYYFKAFRVAVRASLHKKLALLSCSHLLLSFSCFLFCVWAHEWMNEWMLLYVSDQLLCYYHSSCYTAIFVVALQLLLYILGHHYHVLYCIWRFLLFIGSWLIFVLCTRSAVSSDLRLFCLKAQFRVVCMRSASVRRTSMREKKAISLKEAREEAQKLLESANASVAADEDDDEAKSNSMNGPPSTAAVTVRKFECWCERDRELRCH